MLLSAALLLLGSLAEVSGKTVKGRIVVGGALQNSGKFASYGTQAKNILDMWKVRMQNDTDFPFDIDFKFEDGSTKTAAVAAIENMLTPRTVDSPDVVLPPYTSGSSKAVCDSLDDNDHSVLCGVWGGASETIFDKPRNGEGKNLRVQTFGVAGNYFTAGLEYADAQLRNQTPGRTPTAAFIWRDTDAFSKSLCIGARAKATELGYSIALESAIDPLYEDPNDLTTETIYKKMQDCDDISKVPFVDLYDVTQRALNPLVNKPELADVIVGCGLYDSQTAIILGLIARRIRPAFTLMTNVANSKLLRSALPVNVLDIFMPTQWTPSQSASDEVFGSSMDFFSAYKSQFSGRPTYHGASLGGFLVMLTRALKHSQNDHTCTSGECELDAVALRAAFRAPEVKKDSFYGLVDVDENGMNKDKSLIQVQMQLGEGGSFVQVPAVPVIYKPESWTAPEGTSFPRWPARSWSEVKTDFINSYCGAAGLTIDDFTTLRVALERAENHFVDFGTSTYPGVGDVGNCTPCARGMSRPPNFGECYHCVPGTFAAELGQSACTLCPEGKAMDRNGALQCDDCTRGRVAGEKGLKTCHQCPRGRFMPEEGKSECESCPQGRYQPDSGQSECTLCVDTSGAEMTTPYLGSTSTTNCTCKHGTFKELGSEVCVACPATMVFSSKAPASFPCSCPEGSFLLASGRECRGCPKGMTCAAGTAVPLVDEGNWVHSSDASSQVYDVYRCRDNKQCPGGAAGTCAEGRDPNSLGCADCLEGWVPDSSGDTCHKCAGMDFFPFISAILLSLCILTAMAYFSTVNVMKTNLNTLVSLAIAGQCVVAIQWLTVFGELDLTWVEPLAGLLKADGIKIISFNFDALKLGCLIPGSNVVTTFLLRLLCFPVGALVLVLMMFATSKYQKRALDVNQVVNSLGLILVVLFLSLTMVAFTPFICVDSPNGKMSMLSNPSVICDNNDDFVGLGIFGVIGLFVYSVAPLTIVGYTTYRVPALVASGHGGLLVTRYKFLFQRFTVPRYYYAAIFLARNFLMALVPVVFSNFAHLQIIVMGMMFVIFGLLSAYIQPWRGKFPNVLEAMVMGHFLVALMVAGVLMEADKDEVVADLQVILTLLMIGSAVPFCGVGGYLVYKRLTASKKPYGMFLSHHKLSMAVGARLIKTELSRLTSRRVFLDSDELDDLDSILNTVRCGIEYLVVLLTTETLWRPWCAGEIATAHMNQVPIVCVSSDGYTEPADEDIEVTTLSKRWTAEEFAPMALQGVAFAAVREAYLTLRSETKIEWKRAGWTTGHRAAFLSVVETIATTCNYCKQGRPSIANAPAINSDVVVVANPEDGEAISGAMLLSHLLRGKTQWSVTEAFSEEDLSKQKGQEPESVVVCLTKDCLRSLVFAKMLLAIQSAIGSAYLMTTRSPDFQFPVLEVLGSVQAQLAECVGVGAEEIQAAFAPVLSSLALPFFASGQHSLVMAETQAIVDRLFRSQNRAMTTNSNVQSMSSMRSMRSMLSLRKKEDSKDTVPVPEQKDSKDTVPAVTQSDSEQ